MLRREASAAKRKTKKKTALFRLQTWGLATCARFGWILKIPHARSHAMVRLARCQDQALLCRDAFDSDPPLAGGFASSVGGFGAGDHGQDLVVAESFAHLLRERAPLRVVRRDVDQCNCRQGVRTGVCHARCRCRRSLTLFILLPNLVHDVRVAMALVRGAETNDEIEILFAVHILHPRQRKIGISDASIPICMISVCT